MKCDGGTSLKSDSFMAGVVIGKLTSANFRSPSVQQNGTNIVIRPVLWSRSTVAGQLGRRSMSSLAKIKWIEKKEIADQLSIS